MEKAASKKSLVNVLGAVYVHSKTSDGGDLYLTRFAEQHQEHFQIENWYEKHWFDKHKVRLKGTSSVYRVPTKEVEGKSLDLVVKTCRVGEDVPLDTHTLQEFCDAEFNSPWEEFSLVFEMRDGLYGPKNMKVKTQRPLAIYVPPERMQLWQSGRSRAKINRIRAKHPGIDLDILKQYKLIYEWIRGKNLTELFERIDINHEELVHHLKTLTYKAIVDMCKKGFLIADMKPEHVVLSEADSERIEKIGLEHKIDPVKEQVALIYKLLDEEQYSVIDYELLLRTNEHEEDVKSTRRHSYLDDQRDRFKPTPLPPHLSYTEILDVPYIYGHAESTGGHLWVVGRNARLFDYFLPERWRKTPSLKLSETKDVFYTITKDNIRLVWKASRVGEIPVGSDEGSEESSKILRYGINSPFEEFAISHKLNQLGIPSVYVRAIYMTGVPKIEVSSDRRKYESHKDILDPEGNPILQESYNYITIRGYYNGPDHLVAKQAESLYMPLDLSKAPYKSIIDEEHCQRLLEKTKQRLADAGYDGSLLKTNDLLLAVDEDGNFMKDEIGEPMIILCNFEFIWKTGEPAFACECAAGAN